MYALNALKNQFLGEGGGDEAARSQFLGGLERRLGVSHGFSVFNDLRQNTNAGSPIAVDGIFNYEHAPAAPGAPGSVVLDPGSFRATPAVPQAVAARFGQLEPHANAQRADDREPVLAHRAPAPGRGPADRLLLSGPDLRDRHARTGLNWRGATSAPFPGCLL